MENRETILEDSSIKKTDENCLVLEKTFNEIIELNNICELIYKPTNNNENTKTIINVYKIKLLNGNAPGFGDYLRGCLFLLKISNELNYNFNMDMSHHPISNYLKKSLSIGKINYDNINFLIDNKIDTYYESPYSKNKYRFYMNAKTLFEQSKTNIIPLFTNAFPLNNNMSEDECDFFKNNLKPNSELNEYIDHTLKFLNLEKKKYSVIHVRVGDEYLSENKAINKIQSIIDNRKPEFLLI